MKNIPLFRWIKFAIVAIIYILWVLWVGSFWLFIGLPVIFDIYITKKVPWDFWKKPKNGKKPNTFIEWADAIIFALIAVYIINIFLFQNYKIPTSSLEKSLLIGDHLFVSKVSYGPRMPNTPLAFPLVQNTMPIIGTKSYSEWPTWDYKRLKGLGEVKKRDIVVFNFPTGDTIAFLQQNPDIYILSRQIGASIVSNDHSLLKGISLKNAWERNHFLMSIGLKYIKSNAQNYGEIMYRPVDKRENYVKRCVATPGDTLEIRHNQIYINNKIFADPENVQYDYHIITDGSSIPRSTFKECEVSKKDQDVAGRAPHYRLTLQSKMVNVIKKVKGIREIYMDEEQPDSSGCSVYPYSPDYPWSRDNYGPLYIPKAGETVNLNITNIVLYERIITAYEGNKLDIINNEIIINDKKATSYTFKMNYYFMMGDNRHQSADSRYWGFVPEDHIVGQPLLVWLSLDEDKGSFPFNIRWNRFFKWVANE
ncbi:MAG: S26 family signal peptidase [Marinilabiliaceae bacterium]|nr:S26 family signal peptidase [Marinilabiliaceae bacterium]